MIGIDGNFCLAANSGDSKQPGFPVASRAGELSALWPRRTPQSTDDERSPAVYERLVEPEGRDEIIGGERIIVPPSDPPHATQHFRLSYVVAAYTTPGYPGASICARGPMRNRTLLRM